MKSNMIFLGEQGPGCFTIAKVQFNVDKGVVIEMPNGERIPSKNNAGVVCVGLDLQEAEAVGRVSCFKDKVYTYAFGMMPGQVRVRLVCFFGSSRSSVGGREGNAGDFEDQEIGDSFKQLIQTYNRNRISVSLKQVKVYIPGRDFVLKGDLDSISSSTKDPNNGMQDVTLQLTTTEPQGRF